MPLRLLVIDDSLTIRKSVELLAMKGEGHQLEFASAGQEGISKARAQPPDVILLDFVLPDMKGTDVCRGLSQDARTASLPSF